MTIQELHYDFKIKLDKVDSLSKRNFHPAQIDWLLNEATWKFIEEMYGMSLQNPDRGFEVSEIRTQDLRNLHITSPQVQSPIAPSGGTSGVYELNLADLTFDYWLTTKLNCRITKNNCSKDASITVVQTDDLSDALVDPFNKPSYSFGRVLGNYGKSLTDQNTTYNQYGTGSLYLYTNNDFTVDSVSVSYLRYPQRVWIGTYDLTNDLLPKSASNTYVYQSGVDLPVSSDIASETAQRKIVDKAVELSAMLIEDPNLVRLKQLRVQNHK